MNIEQYFENVRKEEERLKTIKLNNSEDIKKVIVKEIGFNLEVENNLIKGKGIVSFRIRFLKTNNLLSFTARGVTKRFQIKNEHFYIGGIGQIETAYDLYKVFTGFEVI